MIVPYSNWVVIHRYGQGNVELEFQHKFKSGDEPSPIMAVSVSLEVAVSVRDILTRIIDGVEAIKSQTVN